MPKSRTKKNYQHRYSKQISDALDHQINMELKASYIYQLMSAWFSHSDIALPGFIKYFAKQSDEEKDHAQKFIDYQIQRGNFVQFKDIKINDIKSSRWKHPLDVLKQTLALEKIVTDHIYYLTDLATKHNEHHLVDWLGTWLTEQITSVKILEDFITNVQRVGSDEGLYLLDQTLLKALN